MYPPMDLYDDVFLYDLVHRPLADPDVFSFFQNAVQQYGQPVLELASGSGNILIPLAESGIDITGIDLSDSMLAACRRKAAERDVKVRIEKGDMRGFDLDRKFPLIYIAGNSLQHLNTVAEISECFESIKRHLAPNGKLLVEVFNPYIPLLAREMGRRYSLGTRGDYDLTEDVDYDAASQVSNINWHFRHTSTDIEKTLSFTMRQFFPQELDSLFVLHGFKIEHKFGDFDSSDFRSSSPAQIVIASAG